MQLLKSVALAYESSEDRILAVVNPGHPDTWSCWLTRRLVLALLNSAPKFMASTSTLAQRAPADFRGEIVAFERDAAMATTAKAMTRTPPDLLKSSSTAAELADRLTISSQGDNFRLELHGIRGGGAAGMLARADLQRILQMLQDSVAKASWLDTPAEAPPSPEEPAPKPARH